MELVKIRLQLQGSQKFPPLVKKSALTIVKELGFKGLYTGVLVTFMRDIPFSIIFFPTYANLKEQFKDNKGDLSLFRLFLASFVAGGLAAGLVTPADVVKTRCVIQSNTASNNVTYPSSFVKVTSREWETIQEHTRLLQASIRKGRSECLLQRSPAEGGCDGSVVWHRSVGI
jgi:hypothetical protein